MEGAEVVELVAAAQPPDLRELRLPRRELLRDGGAPVSPKEIGISRELFHNSLLKGYTVRPRYSVMEFAKEHGRLEEIADKITAELYD